MMAQDFTYQTQNYEAQGGSLWVIGLLGTLRIYGTLDATGATLVGVASAALALVKKKAAVGLAAPGSITVAGVGLGDHVVGIIGAPTAGGSLAAFVAGTDFEATVSIAGHIQQLTAVDLHLDTLIFDVVPAGS